MRRGAILSGEEGCTVAQKVRFCTSFDGVRIAYAADGAGPPLVRELRDNAQIAATLGMSEKTVRNHITRIFRTRPAWARKAPRRRLRRPAGPARRRCPAP